MDHLLVLLLLLWSSGLQAEGKDIPTESVRLVGGDSRCAGTLEVKQGEWRPVELSFWTLKTAAFVCKELDCGPPVVVGGRQTSLRSVWFISYRCVESGSALRECVHTEFSSTILNLNCSDSVRLVDGTSLCSGRLEVKSDQSNQSWSSVCEVDFDQQDAEVVCRELGCEAPSVLQGVLFGDVEAPKWTKEFQCGGDESSLLDCRSSGSDRNTCSPGRAVELTCSEPVRLVGGESRCSGTLEVKQGEWKPAFYDNPGPDLMITDIVCKEIGCGSVVSLGRREDSSDISTWMIRSSCLESGSALRECVTSSSPSYSLGVTCSDSVRLVNGTSLCSGRLEVKSDQSNQSWSSVCEHDFDQQDAEVVCRELGCGAPSVLQGTLYREVEAPKWTKEFQCEGDESSLLDCRSSGSDRNTCSPGRAVELTCSEPVRLVGGDSRCAGTLEVKQGEWRPVGDNNPDWTLKIAAAVCKVLDCGSALSVGQREESSLRSVWRIDSGCFLPESALRECVTPSSAPLILNLTCSDSVRLVDGKSLCSGRLEVKFDQSNQSWSSVCEDDFDQQDAEVVCRQLGCGAPSVLQGALFGEEKAPKWTKEFQCGEDESALLDCRSSGSDRNTCSAGRAVELTCSEPVRLVGGDSRCAGTLEVEQGAWRPVGEDCMTHYSMLEIAADVCRAMGCGSVVSVGQKKDSSFRSIWSISHACTPFGSFLRECVKPHFGPVTWNLTCSDMLLQPNISASSSMDGVSEAQHQGLRVSMGSDFTVSCSIQPQYPGGSFQLSFASSYSAHNYTQPVVNNSAHFLFPAAKPVHQGSYSCVYQVHFVSHSMSSESRQLSVSVLDPRPFIIRVIVLPLTLLLANTALYFYFKTRRGQKLGRQENTKLDYYNLSVRVAEGGPTEEEGAQGADFCPESVRLVGGDGRCAGTLEVKQGEWRPVQDSGLTLKTAAFFCKELDCGSPVLLGGRETSFRSVWMIDSRCVESGSALTECVYTLSEFSSSILNLTCSDSVRLVNGTSLCSGRLEVKSDQSNQSWSSVCEDDFDQQDAEVVCRELGCGAPSVLQGALYGEEEASKWTKEFQCEGDESSLLDCRSSGSNRNICSPGRAVELTCSEPVRLVGGQSRCSGTLEVKQGEWKPAFYNDLDLMITDIVCKEMGCGSVVSVGRREDSSDRSTWKIRSTCVESGSALRECVTSSSSSSSLGVTCSDSVRLVDGTSLCSGRLEVKSDQSNQSWSSVCEDDFDQQDAEVVCKELGCGAPSVLQGALYGDVEAPKWTKEFQCGGDESSLLDCRSSGSDRNTCSPGRSVTLTCSEPVRLVGGGSHCAGILEVKQGEWRPVGNTDPDWTLTIAAAVCKELDCGSALSIGQREESSFRSVWWFDSECFPSEAALRECVSPHSAPLILNLTCSDSARLVNGTSLCSGRLEVKSDQSNQSWSSVCEDYFDQQDAEVVCRELGCGAPLALQGVLFGDVEAPKWTKEFQCGGDESSLLDCRSSGSDRNTCSPGRAVELTCSEPVRLVGGDSRCAGTLEVEQGEWRPVGEDNMNHDSTLKIAADVCRAMGCGSVVSVGQKKDSSFRSIWKISEDCTDFGSFLRECVTPDFGSVTWNLTCSDMLLQPNISASSSMDGVSEAQQQGLRVSMGSDFTVSCSIQPQYPGGSFQLSFTSSYSAHNYTQPAVNHSAHFLFPAAKPVHQGSYSCVYHVHFVSHNMSSESRQLSVSVLDPRPFIIRVTVLPLTLLLANTALYFYFKTSRGQKPGRQENTELDYYNLSVRVAEGGPTEEEGAQGAE
ncbi:scavenger receptor cysteine-rich type 1 protein M130-like [Centropristis striata]|uniref:scavenger receptor cysteine-rich type 1 protein M130-like n=1 Tax=Centropristis striata TaxID=184440 RepID=UPI0027DED125|nr:scavenger receptor cysteine-rich type 1 protein M130-like [Centropristis striata]